MADDLRAHIVYHAVFVVGRVKVKYDFEQEDPTGDLIEENVDCGTLFTFKVEAELHGNVEDVDHDDAEEKAIEDELERAVGLDDADVVGREELLAKAFAEDTEAISSVYHAAESVEIVV